MYRHKKVNEMMDRARRTITELFGQYLSEPAALPSPWSDRALSHGADTVGRARVVCDYIAGMTDTYAIDEHRRLFNSEPWD
jgi:dGTPase